MKENICDDYDINILPYTKSLFILLTQYFEHLVKCFNFGKPGKFLKSADV